MKLLVVFKLKFTRKLKQEAVLEAVQQVQQELFLE
jgi:hypothetical protein